MSTEIKPGTWIEWRGKLRRACSAPQPFSKGGPVVVDFCEPYEWDQGHAGEGYDVDKVCNVRVLDEDEALEWWAEIQARQGSKGTDTP